MIVGHSTIMLENVCKYFKILILNKIVFDMKQKMTELNVN